MRARSFLLLLSVLALALLADALRLPKFRKVNLVQEPQNYQDSVTKQRHQVLVDQIEGAPAGTPSSQSERGASLLTKQIRPDSAGTLTRFFYFFKNVRIWGAVVMERVFQQRVAELRSKGDLDAELDEVFRGLKNPKTYGPKQHTTTTKTILIPREKRLRGIIYESQEKDDHEDIPLAEFESPQAVLERIKSQFPSHWISDEVAEFVLFPVTDEVLRLAYFISFFKEIPPKGGLEPSLGEFRQIIDVETGQVLKEWDGLAYVVQKLGTGPGGNVRSGRILYGFDEDNLEVDNRGGTCFYQTTKIITHRGFFAFERRDPFAFLCFNQASDDDGVGSFSPVNDAHARTTFVADVFADPRVYGTRLGAINPNMEPLTVVVNDEGVLPQLGALWNQRRIRVARSVASGTFAAVTLDLLAHEIGHGITEGFSDLTLDGESGGLNEAFSDLVGQFAVFIKTKRVDWTFGRTLTRDGRPLRSMLNPTSDGLSIGHTRDFQNQDPHFTSGIFNRFFALFGLSSPFGAWDVMDAVLVANRDFWTKESTFEEAAQGILEAMGELRAGKHFAIDYSHLRDEIAVNAFQSIGLRCTRTGSWNCVNIP